MSDVLFLELTGIGLGLFFDKAGGDFVPVIYQEFLQKFEAQPLVQIFVHLRSVTIPYVQASCIHKPMLMF
jgi:KUP system potassium uptake protein